MTDNIEKALAQAAASPDPYVRNMASRYYKLQQEQTELDSFFTAYNRILHNTGAPAAPSASPRPAAERRPAASRTGTMATGKRGQVDEFVKEVCSMLRTLGAPMPLTTLYDQFFQQHPDLDRTTCSQDTFRQRLTKKPYLIRTIDHKYWPTNEPLPGGDQSLAA